jgi:AmmeMemoRadiSam system protein B
MAMSSTVRLPAVAGRFYPAQPGLLRRELQDFLVNAGPKLPALGCIVPHAGYMYSGHVAGAVFATLQLPRRFIVLCPNHTGMGASLSIMRQGAWQMPLGKVPVDQELAGALIAAFPALQDDPDAQLQEHAIEVQLPFLQQLCSDFTFVPITVGTSRLELLQGLGQAMATVVRQQQQNTLIIASSDMNHYESDQVTRIKDRRALDRILDLDPAGLYDVVVNQNITMCGFGPAVAMLTAARQLGATQARLIKYATSGDTSGDRDMVVGYAGVAVL